MTSATKPADSPRPPLHALTGLRFFAAAWVVIEHFRNPISDLFPVTRHVDGVIRDGYLGVEIFFILSGFIISYQYAERLSHFTNSAYRHFLRLRLARLYPVHLVTLLIVLLLVVAAHFTHRTLTSGAKYTPLSFVMNLLLLQAVPPAQAWDGPAWSITAEWFAYVAFPIIALALFRVHRARTAVIVACIALISTMAWMLLVQSGSQWSPIDTSQIGARIAGEFIAGCFLWRAWTRLGSLRATGWDWAATVAVASIVTVACVTKGESPGNFFALPFIALFVFTCAAPSGLLRRILSWHPIEYGGRISYSLYMTHFIVLDVVGKVMPWRSHIDGSVVVRAGLLFAYAGALAGAAVLSYHLVEEPARKWLRRPQRPGLRNKMGFAANPTRVER